MDQGYGSDPQNAFGLLVEEAQYENGHGGYTGTIAEKRDFVVIEFDESLIDLAPLREHLKVARTALKAIPEGQPAWKGASRIEATIRRYAGLVEGPDRFNRLAETYADRLIDASDSRIEDKWGPAGCIELKSDRKGQRLFLFFGVASS